MPKCGLECEVYSRVTGYFRPVKSWNKGKREEWKDRKTYDLGKSGKVKGRRSEGRDVQR